MTTVVCSVTVSLDGFLIPPGSARDERDGSRTPSPEPGDGMPAPEVIIVGRHTAAAARRAARWPWPQQTVIALLHSESPAERDARLCYSTETPSGLLTRLQRDGIGRAQLAGGSTLISVFHAAGLIDEWLLRVTPVLLGDGRPLFGPGTHPSTLALVHAWGYPDGAVRLHYRRGDAGPSAQESAQESA